MASHESSTDADNGPIMTEEEMIEEIFKIDRELDIMIDELNIAHERRSKKLAQQMRRLEEIQETFDWFLMK
jgi:hypothetical protein